MKQSFWWQSQPRLFRDLIRLLHSRRREQPVDYANLHQAFDTQLAGASEAPYGFFFTETTIDPLSCARKTGDEEALPPKTIPAAMA
jgi:hypothetical protein